MLALMMRLSRTTDGDMYYASSAVSGLNKYSTLEVDHILEATSKLPVCQWRVALFETLLAFLIHS